MSATTPQNAEMQALEAKGWKQVTDQNITYWQLKNLRVKDIKEAQALDPLVDAKEVDVLQKSLPEREGWEIKKNQYSRVTGDWQQGDMYYHQKTGALVVNAAQADALDKLYLQNSELPQEHNRPVTKSGPEEKPASQDTRTAALQAKGWNQVKTAEGVTRWKRDKLSVGTIEGAEGLEAFFRMRRWGSGIFLGGLLLGSGVATLTFLFPPVFVPALAVLLGLTGLSALTVVPVIAGVMSMLIGVEFLAFLERRNDEKQGDYAKLMQYLILSTALLGGSGVGLFLAAGYPVLLDLGFGLAAGVGGPGALAIVSVLAGLVSVGLALLLLHGLDRLTLSMPWSAKVDSSKKAVPEIPGGGMPNPTNSARLHNPADLTATTRSAAASDQPSTAPTPKVSSSVDDTD